MPSHILYGKVKNFQADVPALRAHYENVIAKTEATPYFDNGTEYEGWSITSRDGTVLDGVRHIGKDARVKEGVKITEAVKPTPLCTGAMMDTLNMIGALGLPYFRARVMRLKSEKFKMIFHRDAQKEAWRLHVPVITNPDSFFEWKLADGKVTRVHFPADGGAYLVRVDEMHRAVNNAPAGTPGRVHLLMSLRTPPDESLIEA